MARRFPQSSKILQELADAIRDRKPKKFESLLKRSVNINAFLDGFDGMKTPFQRAVGSGSHEIALALFDAGARLQPRDLNLVWAVTAGRPDVVAKFIRQGADLNAKSMMGTPITVAASRGHTEIVRLLINAGADIDAGSVLGTPLAHAVQHDHTKTALLLIVSGASREVPRGVPTLLEIAQEKKNATLIAALRSKPAKKPKAPATLSSTAKPRPPATTAAPAKTIEGFPDFTARSRRKPYRAALAKLQTLCGTPPQPMEHAPGGFTFHLHAAKAKIFNLDRVHEEFLKQGAYVFTTDASPPRDTIAILPTTDPYEVMAAMATSGTNYDLSPEDVIEWMRELAKEQPYVLTGISWDFLDGHFTSKIKDPAGVAERMVKFCPDLENAKPVAKHLRTGRSPRLFFWWD